MEDKSDHPVVSVSAPVWAVNLFDCVNSPTDSEGLVFGRRSVRKVLVTTDEAQGVEKSEEVIRIQYTVPTGIRFSFYDRSYSVSPAKLTEFVEKFAKQGNT